MLIGDVALYYVIALESALIFVKLSCGMLPPLLTY